ncbi:MAG: PEP-CTERM sorting domain-containing protein [Planctomycetota bacterium]|jgi:hypothetical protein
MMKNLLIVMLVLGLTSLASAAIVSQVDEGTTISVASGATVRLNTNSDTGLTSLDAVATVVGGDVVSGATNLGDAASFNWDPSLSYAPAGIGTPAAEIGFGTFGVPPAGVVGYFDIAYTGGTQSVTITNPMGFEGSADTSYVAPNFSADTVTIIPEPTTIALLGLSALALLLKCK